VSLNPWARMDTNTHSAATLKIRENPWSRINSQNVIVATPFGPNHAMNACR
jgi:hypothetical protein